MIAASLLLNISRKLQANLRVFSSKPLLKSGWPQQVYSAGKISSTSSLSSSRVMFWSVEV
jgi:hypothetical protein